MTWLSTAPLMLMGLLAGHALGYRLAYADAHARADALAHSGHGYLGYVPFTLTICVAVLICGPLLQGLEGFRGRPRRAVFSPLLVLLSPAAFVAQEVTERLVHTGHAAWSLPLQPAFLFGLALQLPFALAALVLAWALDSAARATGLALSAAQVARRYDALVPVPVRAVATPRAVGLARGYGERAPPLLRRP